MLQCGDVFGVGLSALCQIVGEVFLGTLSLGLGLCDMPTVTIMLGTPDTAQVEPIEKQKHRDCNNIS